MSNKYLAAYNALSGERYALELSGESLYGLNRATDVLLNESVGGHVSSPLYGALDEANGNGFWRPLIAEIFLPHKTSGRDVYDAALKEILETHEIDLTNLTSELAAAGLYERDSALGELVCAMLCGEAAEVLRQEESET